MNRRLLSTMLPDRQTVPHRRGDEPCYETVSEGTPVPFPTGVGMNRRVESAKMNPKTVPTGVG